MTVQPRAAGLSARRSLFPVIAGDVELAGPSRLIAPSVTEYVSASSGVQWTSETGIGKPVVHGPYTLIDGPGMLQPATTYRAGRTYNERFGAGPLGPGFPATHDRALWASRTGDNLVAGVPSLTDADGHASRIYLGDSIKAATALYRNGTLVGKSDYYGWGGVVPPEAADYRLESTVTGGLGGLSTEVSSVFTFRSARTDPNKTTKLPLSAVRYTPKLDKDNAAPAGTTLPIPVTVQRQPGSQAAAVKTLTVDVSYDDGRTWKPATLRRAAGTTWTATVTHPGTAGYVSLRARSADSAGNSVDQTIIRAYRISAR